MVFFALWITLSAILLTTAGALRCCVGISGEIHIREILCPVGANSCVEWHQGNRSTYTCDTGENEICTVIGAVGDRYCTNATSDGSTFCCCTGNLCNCDTLSATPYDADSAPDSKQHVVLGIVSLLLSVFFF
jgi:hypothetical protein